jgi:hypothetical protein
LGERERREETRSPHHIISSKRPLLLLLLSRPHNRTRADPVAIARAPLCVSLSSRRNRSKKKTLNLNFCVSSSPQKLNSKKQADNEPNDGPPGPTIDDYEVVNDEEPQDEYIARAGENRDEAADDDDDEAPPDDEEEEGEDLLGDGFLK